MEYVPYGDQWKEEMMKLNKKELVRMVRHIQLSERYTLEQVIEMLLACEDLEVNRKASYRVDGVEIPCWKVATKADIISKLGGEG